MREATDLRAAVVGTGFIGVVHVDALRRLGVEVLGVVGSSPERARAKSGPIPLPEPYDSFEEMLADDRVDVVHLTTPNHLHYPQARAALESGKHVVCEKPLAIDSQQSRDLLVLARRSGLVHCTNFNIRFYPQCQEARALVHDGRVGEVWNVHGGYLQDWLLLPTDWNWRLEPDKGGTLRAVADIGSHWLDLVQFVTGRRVTELLADLATTIPVRRRPTAEVETFAAAGDVERADTPVTTEDVAHLLLGFEGDARGSAVISQISAGRRNSLRFEIDGSAGSIFWDAERHEELWLGHRDRPNETLIRDPALLEPDAAKRTGLPAGHAEGFADTFKELYRAVYAAVAAGTMPDEPDFPTFADGHRANLLGDAVAESARNRRWVEVPS
jgi:predicted dehydrogenase